MAFCENYKYMEVSMKGKYYVKQEYYCIEFHKNGFIKSLQKDEEASNIIKKNSKVCGLPFVRGTQRKDHITKFSKLIWQDKNHLFFKSNACQMWYTFNRDTIVSRVKFLNRKGPRVGINFDFNFLDSDEENYSDKLMMTEAYTDAQTKFGYYLFRQSDGSYFCIAIQSKFAGYRLKYSYFGHRIKGFQILAAATDIDGIVDEVESFQYTMLFADDLMKARNKIQEILGIGIPNIILSGSNEGSLYSFTCNNMKIRVRVEDPKGRVVSYTKSEDKYSFPMDYSGMYKVVISDRRKVTYYFLCYKTINYYYESVCDFNFRNFQHSTGAFYRAISKATLRPDKRTLEGVHFGNPYEKMSCRTGEFGGFAAWSISKYLETTDKKYLKSSLTKYIKDWALNGQGNQPTLYGTVYREKQKYGCKNYSPYHLYKEPNFPQYELFLIEELIDYYKLTKEKEVLEEVYSLADHFIEDHIREGMIIYHNTDYTSVHAPCIAFIKLMKLSECTDEPTRAKRYYLTAKSICNHIYHRKDEFPTEGEKCTEDGSIACSALQLAYYCWHVEYVPQYHKMAKEFIEIHRMLDYTVPDARMYQSSIRFWETLYESSDFGPSYNCGHGWTIWTSEAKFYLGLLEKKQHYLIESYNGFISNMAKVEANGGMTACYTPDMIPGTPHHYFLIRYDIRGALQRRKTSYIATGYSTTSYSTSGNYFLIKFSETFDYLSSYNMKENIPINMTYDGSSWIGLGRKFDTLILTNIISGRMQLRINNPIKVYSDQIERVLMLDSGGKEIKIREGDLLEPIGGYIQLKCI